LFQDKKVLKNLIAFSKEKFDSLNLVLSLSNLQIYLNDELINQKKLDRKLVINTFIQFLEKQENVLRAFSYEGDRPFPKIPILEKFEAGYFKGKSGDIQIVLSPGTMDRESKLGTTHGAPYSYDSHVPCLWMGWKILPGSSVPKINIEDIAPTLASLLKIMEPNGSTGKPQTIPTKP
jgi:hypothetical protein